MPVCATISNVLPVPPHSKPKKFKAGYYVPWWAKTQNFSSSWSLNINFTIKQTQPISFYASTWFDPFWSLSLPISFWACTQSGFLQTPLGILSHPPCTCSQCLIHNRRRDLILVVPAMSQMPTPWGVISPNGLGLHDRACVQDRWKNGDWAIHQHSSRWIPATVEFYELDREKLIFQQDNDPKHTSKKPLKLFQQNKNKLSILFH